MMNKIFITFFALFLSAIFINGQEKNLVYVDDKGILRWSENDEEAAFYGVNYASPFAHSYRSLKKKGIDIKKQIDIDVAHFARLEFNAFRIHVWDREVSDKEGNLLENEHIELLDYLIHKLKERGIYTILTPIAWWGTGWPEPDIETPGFSTGYSKVKMITEPDARKSQANYLKQFVNHTNKYENLSYKDDPYIIAFEIINEPHHPSDTSITSAYIDEMVSILKSEGITKPIYYNISENWNEEQAAVVYNSNIDGITFQWYPTGLVKRSELSGNYLAHVDHYPVPEIESEAFKNKSRLVYEFDAADKSGSYMYPAMARSFKEAGMQWATMFCYDPMYMATYNTEYQTHFLNLIYTPQKALSILIASNIFKDVKAYHKFESYPANLEFDDYKIDYENNLSELNSDTKFYYSNNTSSVPKNISSLEHIAGLGSSHVIETDSRGSYFLDKISDGVWRLEVYPDAVWIADPFGANNLDQKVAEVFYYQSEMKIKLPDLVDNFYLYDLTNETQDQAENNSILIEPGIFVLSQNQIDNPSELNFSYNGIALKDFFVPEKTDKKVYVFPDLKNLYEGEEGKIEIEIFSSENIKEADLYIRGAGWSGFSKTKLNKESKYKYSAELNPNLIRNGNIEFYISILNGEDLITFPGNINSTPDQWDFTGKGGFKLKILPAGNPITLFDPSVDYQNVILPNIWDKVEYSFNLLYDEKNESICELRFNKIKMPLEDFTFQIELDNKISSLSEDELKKYDSFRIELINYSGKIDTIYFRLISENLYSKSFPLSSFNNKNYILSLNNFKEDDFVLLPRPYPRFLPYYYYPSEKIKDESEKITFIQFSIPFSELNEEDSGKAIRIGKIELIKSDINIGKKE